LYFFIMVSNLLNLSLHSLRNGSIKVGHFYHFFAFDPPSQTALQAYRALSGAGNKPRVEPRVSTLGNIQ
jgi:hypothetical protein